MLTNEIFTIMISNSKFNQRLLEKIGERFPKKSQQLEFLMKEMPLGKESAYRRLRGDVPFSFTEACVLSEKLGLSLDTIVSNVHKTERPYFLLHVPAPDEPPKDYTYYYTQTYNVYEAMLDKWVNDPSLAIYAASNIVPQALMLPYPYLSKFRAFVWQYQTNQKTLSSTFSAVTIPDDIIAKQKTLVQRISQLPSITLTISQHIFSILVKMIQYYLKLNLLTKKEVLAMRDELFELLLKMKRLAIYNGIQHNEKLLIYVANIDFDSNYTYVKGKDFERSFIELHFINTISTSDVQICKIQKEWLDFLKKNATLTGMNENAEQIAFFEKQQKLINSLSLI